MRLLWEESGFELVGAFCVAACALVLSWTVLETLFGMNAIVAGLFSAVVAGWLLEMVSRRHYADRLAPAPRRTGRSPLRLARSEALEAPSEAPAAATAASPQIDATPASKPSESERPAAERRAADHQPAPAERGASTVAGRRPGASRRAA